MSQVNEPNAADEMWLLDEPPEAGVASKSNPLDAAPWRVLIVDDEPDVHASTKLALMSVSYKGRKLQVLSAYSALEGVMTMRREPDIALILLDVMMETDDAGLRMARQVREDLGNHLSRIVLRTGQPGQAPESDVIVQYDINDYKCKTDMSQQKLFTTVIASLRTYESLVMIERNRRGLERILDASSDLYHVRSLREFASGVLNQISAILDVGADGVICLRQTGVHGEIAPVVMAATGSYAGINQMSQVPAPIAAATTRAFVDHKSHFEHPLEVLFVATPEGHEFVILVSAPWPLVDAQRSLLELFCSKITWAFDNLHNFEKQQQAQAEFTRAVAALFDALQAGQKLALGDAMATLLPSLSAQSGRSYDADGLARGLQLAMGALRP
jgi:CheY-like chemotaxis protein